MKQEVSDRLLSAVRTVLSGKVYISETMNALLVQRMVGGKNSIDKLPMDRLTDRELEVFRMIGEGMSVKEIAEKLYLRRKDCRGTSRAHQRKAEPQKQRRTPAVCRQKRAGIRSALNSALRPTQSKPADP